MVTVAATRAALKVVEAHEAVRRNLEYGDLVG
jgi:hypothetical protein